MDYLLRNANFRGVQFVKKKQSKKCSEGQCYSTLPICFLHISKCSELPAKWHHFSNGEHVCSECMNKILSIFSYEQSFKEVYDWKKQWVLRAYANSHPNDFIANKLMSFWCLCLYCKKWRQVSRSITMTPADIETFSCGYIIKHTRDACKINEDIRISFIKERPEEFLDSLEYSPLLQSTVNLECFNEFNLDVAGVYPTAKSMNFDILFCADFLKNFHPFKQNMNHTCVTGSFNPVVMEKWEYDKFPAFKTRHRNLFLGVRNLILLLWVADPKRPVTIKLFKKCLVINGLTRVALLERIVPDMIKVYSVLGYINIGFFAPSLPSQLQVFSTDLESNVSEKPIIAIIGASLSGLSASLHLTNMGADVKIFDKNNYCLLSEYRYPNKLKSLFTLQDLDGVINNPLSLIAYQLGMKLKEYEEDLVIYNKTGEQVDKTEDEYYQDLVYKFVSYLQVHSSVLNVLVTKSNATLMDLYLQYRKSGPNTSNRAKSDVLNPIECVYLAELEYRLFSGNSFSSILLKGGADNVTFAIPTEQDRSASKSDGDGNYAWSRSFSGGSNMSPCPIKESGWAKMIEKWAEWSKPLISYSSNVKHIEEINSKTGGKKVAITLDTSGETSSVFMADYVILAISHFNKLSIMENSHDGNCSDGDNVGVVLVNLVFSKSQVFWKNKTNNLNNFSITVTSTCQLTKSDENVEVDSMRGFCHMFKQYDSNDGTVFLQTSIFGDALTYLLSKSRSNTISDDKIIDLVLKKLSCLGEQASSDIAANLLSGEVVKLPSVPPCGSQIIKSKSERIFCTNKNKLMSEPVSLTNSFCAGLDTATELMKIVTMR